jgi:hypothetical protein
MVAQSFACLFRRRICSKLEDHVDPFLKRWSLMLQDLFVKPMRRSQSGLVQEIVRLIIHAIRKFQSTIASSDIVFFFMGCEITSGGGDRSDLVFRHVLSN